MGERFGEIQIQRQNESKRKKKESLPNGDCSEMNWNREMNWFVKG